MFARFLFLFMIGSSCHGFTVQKARKCESSPPTYEHAFLQENVNEVVFDVGTRIRYECEIGYELVGNPQIECILSQGSYVWSRRRFSCNPRSCGDPIVPEYGRIIGCEYTTGSYITFECLIGYTMMSMDGNEPLHDPPFQQCSANGTWTEFVPVCKEIECPELETIANGRMLGLKRTYQSTVYYECDDEYDLVGSDMQRCELDGEWSNAQPICRLAYQNDQVVTPDWMWVPPEEPEEERPSLMQSAVHFGKKVLHLVKSTTCNIMSLFYKVC